MKSIFRGITVAAGLALLPMSANAVVIDFGQYAADTGERGEADGTMLTINTVDITFSATGGFTYFDGPSGGKPGGLGVCTTLNGGDCTPSSDDNVSADESVTLTFAGDQSLSDLTFRDGSHDPLSSSETLLIGIDGGPLMVTTFAAAMLATFKDITSITFAYGGLDPNQFYIDTVTAVPLPAGVLLLLTGLGGLALVGRRRRTAAAV